MAQKVNIVLIDDIDETEADETVSFALDGRDYTIDLSEKNATALREAMALYVAHATPVSGRAKRGRSASSSRAASTSGASPAEIRAWARDNGFDVPDRGRVSQEVRDAYTAAH